MSYSNREKLMNYVQTPPQNDNYVALIILSSTVETGNKGATSYYVKRYYQYNGKDSHYHRVRSNS